MLKVYVSHSIRGKKGTKATLKEMEVNNQKAVILGKTLRKKFGNIEFYVPGDHDEFILIAYLKKYLTEKQILDVDCEIVGKCNFLIVYSPDHYISKGMQIEIDYANKRGIPVLVTHDLGKSAVIAVNKLIKLYMR